MSFRKLYIAVSIIGLMLSLIFIFIYKFEEKKKIKPVKQVDDYKTKDYEEFCNTYHSQDNYIYRFAGIEANNVKCVLVLDSNNKPIRKYTYLPF
jgi:hypothetical protein